MFRIAATMALAFFATSATACDRPPKPVVVSSQAPPASEERVAEPPRIEFWGTEKAPFLAEGRLYLGKPGDSAVKLATGETVFGFGSDGEVNCKVAEVVDDTGEEDCSPARFAEIDCPSPLESPFVATPKHRVEWYASASVEPDTWEQAATKLRATPKFEEITAKERNEFAEIPLHVVLDDDVRAFGSADGRHTYAFLRFALSENADGSYYADSATGPLGGYVEALIRIDGGEPTIVGDVRHAHEDAWLTGAADLDGDGVPEFLLETHLLGSSILSVIDPIDGGASGRTLETCGPLP